MESPDATLNAWQYELFKLAKEKGFGPPTYPASTKDYDYIARKTMLVVCELAEAVEELRKHCDNVEEIGKITFTGNKPEGFSTELIDAIIRLFNLCSDCGINVEQVMTLKHSYNKTRPYRHGKVF